MPPKLVKAINFRPKSTVGEIRKWRSYTTSTEEARKTREKTVCSLCFNFTSRADLKPFKAFSRERQCSITLVENELE